MTDLAERAWAHVEGKLPTRPYFVVTCMDPRIDIARVLGVDLRQTNIIRNAGGRVTDDVVRSLLVAYPLMNTSEVIIMHHTGCGMLLLTDDEFRALAASRTGTDPSGIDFHSIDDLGTSVRADVAAIRDRTSLPDSVRITGCIYHLDEDRLERLGS